MGKKDNDLIVPVLIGGALLIGAWYMLAMPSSIEELQATLSGIMSGDVKWDDPVNATYARGGYY